ncbi:hypothetical protein ACIBP6_32070 [Nonomuraea terrae]|uniref:hypothetical protein n=1 Tax=Nonomuraea terrae TaxID=2530383 RepID=UPI0037B60A43
MFEEDREAWDSISIVVHGTNATWTFEGRQIQTTQSLQRTNDGILGLIMEQATASFRHITVTQLPRPVIPLVQLPRPTTSTSTRSPAWPSRCRRS